MHKGWQIKMRIKNKKKQYAILFRISAFLGVMGAFCLFVSPRTSAEFVVSIAVVLINGAVATVAAVMLVGAEE